MGKLYKRIDGGGASLLTAILFISSKMHAPERTNGLERLLTFHASF